MEMREKLDAALGIVVALVIAGAVASVVTWCFAVANRAMGIVP